MRNVFAFASVALATGCGSSAPSPAAPHAEAGPTAAPATSSSSGSAVLAPTAPGEKVVAGSPANSEFEVYVTDDPEWRHQRATDVVRAVTFPPLTKRWTARVGK